MGQHQLLLIVLALILVAIAAGIANQLFDSNAEEYNKDQIAYELNNLGMLAQQYYNKPLQMGGGGLSYSGWVIPADLDSTESGQYIIIKADAIELVIQGLPQITKGYNWYVQTRIKRDGIFTQILN